MIPSNNLEFADRAKELAKETSGSVIVQPSESVISNVLLGFQLMLFQLVLGEMFLQRVVSFMSQPHDNHMEKCYNVVVS